MYLGSNSIGQFYKDNEGNLYECLREVKSCCYPIMYHMRLDRTLNVYAYDRTGRRLNHQGNPVGNAENNLKL